MNGQERYRIEQVISDVFGGLHNAPKIGWHEADGPFGWAEINPYGSELATFDADRLTRLVFSCHDWCVRAEFNASGPKRVKVRLHPRSARTGGGFERHPTLSQAVEKWRRAHDIEDGL